MNKNIFMIFFTVFVVAFLFLANSIWMDRVYVKGSNTDVVVKPTGDEENLINLPKRIYNTAGMNMLIYYQNLVGEKINDKFSLKLKYDNASAQQKDYIQIQNGEPGINTLSGELYNRGELSAVEDAEVITSEKRTSLTKGLVIGDSTVITNGNGYVTQRIIDNLGSNVELVGTMGRGSNRFEGRGGWSTATYRTDELYNNIRNPFYNPEKKDFDFKYYMDNQGFSDLNFVIINLGINDVIGYKSRQEMVNNVDNIIANYDHILKSIQSYDSNIKIAINLPIPPTDNEEMFVNEFGNSLSQSTVKENNFLFVKHLIDYYGKSQEIDLVPIFMVVDTKNNFESSAHPNANGYRQIGDQITSYLNSLK